MLAYAAFAVSAALSILYVAAGRALKSHTLSGPATRLPTLSYLERANRTSLGLGIIALGTGLALGLPLGLRASGRPSIRTGRSTRRSSSPSARSSSTSSSS